jgi:hypothetical protein
MPGERLKYFAVTAGTRRAADKFEVIATFQRLPGRWI